MKNNKSQTTLIAIFLACGTVLTASAASTVGLNFCSQWGAPHVGAGNTADGFNNWTESRAVDDTTNPEFGTISLLGSSITATWNAGGFWYSGDESAPERSLYRAYLDDGDGGNSLYGGDGIGVSVTISGLSAWLAASGATSYEIRAYGCTDRSSAWAFQPVSVRSGAPVTDLTSLAVLDTINVSVLGNGNYPTGGLGDGDLNTIRGYGDSSLLTADTITLTIPIGDFDPLDQLRGTLSALKITAIPEPSALSLAGLGGLALLFRRRGKN